jgi:hypothetical protein
MKILSESKIILEPTLEIGKKILYQKRTKTKTVLSAIYKLNADSLLATIIPNHLNLFAQKK